MRKKTVLTRLAVVVALLSGLGSFSLVSSEEFGPAKVAYQDYIKRPSLQMRTRGRIKLASTSHPGAFQILKDSYDKPESPKDQVKYLLASICADHFGDEEFTDGWAEWRKRHDKTEDAWLWYRSLILHQYNRGEDDLFKVADENKDLMLQAAALEALAENGSEKMLAWWEKKLDEADDWKGFERVIYLETAARCLEAEAYSRDGDQFRRTALKLIPQIEHKKTDERTKLVMARHFRDTFGVEETWIDADTWLEILLNPDKPVVRDSKYAAPPTEFVGVKASGKRIVYVIDMSDSMLKPLSKEGKEDLKKPAPKREGPVTGGGSGHGEEPEEEEEEVEEDPLPWDRINTRFDAAREYLKLSLRALRDDQYYCVIWFGTEHDTLRSTKGLTPATKSNIERTCKELDRFKKGPATTDRKHGTLKGNTNLHGGIHHAFKLHEKGTVKEWEYVDDKTFFTGADTVFILSDGDPTWDDWATNDQRDPWDQTGDPESRTKHPDQEVLNFPGPYGYMYQSTYLPDDVRRLNLFRKAEIHCIGIGEASQSLLHAIAIQGKGVVKMVGG